MSKRKGKLRKDEFVDVNYMTGERRIRREKRLKLL